MPTAGTNSAPARPAMPGRDDVGDELDVGRVVAEEAHPLLGVAHGDEQFAVAAVHQLAGQRPAAASSTAGDDEVDHPLVDRVVEVVAEEALDVGEAVGAAGGALLADQQDHQRGGQRLAEDREVGARAPGAGRPASRAATATSIGSSTVMASSANTGLANGSHHQGSASSCAVELHEVGQVCPAPGVGELEVHGHRVAAEAEEHALAEGQHAAAAPGQADADGDDREAQVLGEQVEPEVASSASGASDEEQRRRRRAKPGQGPPADGPRQPVGALGLLGATVVGVGHARLLVRSVNRPCGPPLQEGDDRDEDDAPWRR